MKVWLARDSYSVLFAKTSKEGKVSKLRRFIYPRVSYA